MFVSVALLTGAISAAPVAPKAVFLRCGAESARLNVQAQAAYLTVGRAQYTMRQVETASGTRYAGNDIDFWQKGATARLTVGKRAITDCVVAPPLERRAYRATGQEPGWSLVIDRMDSSAMFSRADGGAAVVEPLQRWFVAPGGARVFPSVSGRLSVRAEPGGCSDAMNGKPSPDTVVVTFRGKVYRGCGGRAAMNAGTVSAIDGVEWVVESISGKSIAAGSRPTIEVANGRISGRASCNRYTGNATVAGTTISVSPLGLTMMACAPALMTQEQRFMNALQAAQSWNIDRTGALLLVDAKGQTIVARKAG